MATGETRLLTDGEPRKRHPILEALSYVDIGRFAEIAQKFEIDRLSAASEIATLLGEEKADEIARLQECLGAERDCKLEELREKKFAINAHSHRSTAPELLEMSEDSPLRSAYEILNSFFRTNFFADIQQEATRTSNRTATATDILRTILSKNANPSIIENIFKAVKFSRTIDPDSKKLLCILLNIPPSQAGNVGQIEISRDLDVFWSTPDGKNIHTSNGKLNEKLLVHSIGVNEENCSLYQILRNTFANKLSINWAVCSFIESLIDFLLVGEEETKVENENDFFSALARARQRREVKMEEDEIRRTYDEKIKLVELAMWAEYKNIIDKLREIEKVSFRYGDEYKYDDARFEMNKCTCRSIDIGRDIECLPRFEGGLEDVDIQSFKQVHEKIMASRKTVLGRLLLGIFDQDRTDIKEAAALFYQAPTEKAWRLYELYRFAVAMHKSAIEIIKAEFVRIDQGLLEDQLRRVFVAKTLCYIIAKIAVPQLNQELTMAGAMLAPAEIAMTLSELSQASDNPLSPEATKLLEDFSNMISAQREVTHALQVGDPNDTVMTDSTGVREQVAAINSGRIAT